MAVQLHWDFVPETVCAQCGRPFAPRAGERYCSDACRMEARRAYSRAYYAAHREYFRRYRMGLPPAPADPLGDMADPGKDPRCPFEEDCLHCPNPEGCLFE